MPAIRQRIIEYFDLKRITNVPELSRTLGLTKPAVQYHIKQLLEDGRIESTPHLTHARLRGRPVQYYQLAQLQKPNNYFHLSNVLINNLIIRIDNAEEIAIAMKLLAYELANISTLEKNFIKRMEIALKRLSEMNYQPHWEVHATGSRIHFRNCPYAQLAIENPILCQMDEFLLEHMLGLSVSPVAFWREACEQPADCIFHFTR